MDTQPLVDVVSSEQGRSHEGKLSSPPGLSKNAQKRAAKATRLQEVKLERRAREKEAKKRKNRERAQAIASGELDENVSRKKRRTNGSEAKVFKARVVIDLGFDDLMSDKEINSLTSQLAYTYSANRHAVHAFSMLLFTSLNGRTKQRLDTMNNAGYRRWSRTEWWEEDYDRLWTEGSHLPQLLLSDEMDTQGGPVLPHRADRKNIIYLTADSSEELLELSEEEIYIIGGICDHNRYKNLCLNKAINSQIRHARLPIGRYVSLATRKVLTVNQVFEILLRWIDTRDWEQAFWAVIPKRKFQGGSGCDQGGDEIVEQVGVGGNDTKSGDGGGSDHYPKARGELGGDVRELTTSL